MTKLAKFTLKHKKLLFFTPTIAFGAVWGFLSGLGYLTIPIWIEIIILVAFAISITLLTHTLPIVYLTKKPQSELFDNCDPEPYFNITKELLTYNLSYTDHLATLLDYCVTLRDMGGIQEAYDMLSVINIDKKASTPNVFKAIYYNNLADVCWLLGDNAAADIWCEKMLRIYQDMPQSKFRKHLDSAALISSAERSYRNEDYSMAMLTLNQAELKNTRAKVSAALLRAQIYIKAGNVENARKELDYVISNGNKCYDVTRAKEILNNID